MSNALVGDMLTSRRPRWGNFVPKIRSIRPRPIPSDHWTQAGLLTGSVVRDLESFRARRSNEAVTYAERAVELIAQHAEVHTDAHRNMLAILRATLDDASVYPSMTTDGDDGLIAHWKAGGALIALEVNGNDRYSLVETNGAGDILRNEEGLHAPNLDELRLAIAAFSSSVSHINPDWRTNFK